MTLLVIYGFVFVITFIILGLKFEFKKVSYLKTLSVTFVILLVLLIIGILPTRVGKLEDNAFYTYDIYKSARIFGKGTVNLELPAGVEKIIIHNGIDKLGSCKGYKELKSVEMADSVYEIESSAFLNCTNLSEVELSSDLKIIGDNAFGGCKNLQSIELPEQLEKIGVWAFTDTSITEIKLPDNAVINESTISEKSNSPTFFGCKNLKKVNIGINNKYYVEVDGVVFNKDKTEIMCYPSAKESMNYIIPDSIEVLKLDTFAFCDNLKNITICKNIKTIENNSIWCCENLENIEIINGVEKIEVNAIYSCEKLSNLYIPDSVIDINEEFNYISAEFGQEIKKPIIHCSSNSYAKRFAEQHNYNYIINE